MTLLYLAVLIMVGCGSERHVDPTLAPYVDKFKQVANYYRLSPDVDLNIQKAPLDDDTLGECNYTSKTVTVNSKLWPWVNEDQRTLIMFHELGHCVLFREHRQDRSPAGKPISIMYPEIDVTDTYKDRAKELNLELFFPDLF